MPYTLTISVSLGSSKAGLSLSAQLIDTNAANVGSLITTGFAEVGQGNYLWTNTQMPDGFRGGVKFFNQAAPTVVLAATSINPEEVEDVGKIYTIVTSPRQIEITSPIISGNDSSINITQGSPLPSVDINIKTGVR